VKRRALRHGYTTGACAAAAAKAAAILLLQSGHSREHAGRSVEAVEIPFPDGSRVSFKIHRAYVKDVCRRLTAGAAVIKDAGDDPDVTNGAEIVAEVSLLPERVTSGEPVVIFGGSGVGTVTKPGLAVPVGEPAINPVPRAMIRAAVEEGLLESGRPRGDCYGPLQASISVTDGEKVARKTLNARLGIVGGISILGTTGVVTPLSGDAWTATITASMDVAIATGCGEIVLSAGRASERAHMKTFRFPEEAYVMMGDYLEFSLREAARRPFSRIHLCAQWAKMLKIALATPQTHVKHGVLDTKRAVSLLSTIGVAMPEDRLFNTAREIYEFVRSSLGEKARGPLQAVCAAAKDYAETFTSAAPVACHLVSYEGEIVVSIG
jgi:cobalt-precorrin-5B (C1)-methyltransferase